MLLDLLAQGGAIVWVILVSGVFAFVVFIERALHLHRARIKSDDFLTGVLTILRHGNVAEALAICEETPGPVAYVLKTAILHGRSSPNAIRDAVHEASMAEISRMERRLVVVATVAQLAPLMGLLGTVLGMIDVLLVMQQQGQLIQSANIMGGLMRSLVTTAAGLTVAIPCYAAFNLLAIKVDRIVLDMERVSSEMIAFLSDDTTALKEDVPDAAL